MSHDPQLAGLRRWHEARALRPKPEKDLFALDLYANHKKRFKELGIRYPADLAHCKSYDVATRLQVTRAAAQRLIDVAGLHEMLRTQDVLPGLRVEILRSVLETGPGVGADDVVKDLTTRLWLRKDEATPKLKTPVTTCIAALFPAAPHGAA